MLQERSQQGNSAEAISIGDLTSREILEQLERIVTSAHFRNSRRYPVLLRFLVEETIGGRSLSLKERTIGIVVFGRKHDYDTAADPIVRVSAAETRKRIAQYYQGPGKEDEVRIDLNAGSYIPVFTVYREQPMGHSLSFSETTSSQPLQSTADVPALSQPGETTNREVAEYFAPAPSSRSVFAVLSRERLLWLILCLVCGLSTAMVISKRAQKRHTGLNTDAEQLDPGLLEIWRPVLQSTQPVLLVLGVHSFDTTHRDISDQSHAILPQSRRTLLSSMTESDMIAISDVVTLTRLTSVLGRRGRPFQIKGAADTTLGDFSHGPVVLVGGFNNLWTLRLNINLPFHFVTLNGRTNIITDVRRPHEQWTLDTSQVTSSTYRDYGIVSSYFDQQTEQRVMIVAGIGRSGTEAATDLLTNADFAKSLAQQLLNQSRSNFEVLMYTDVVEGSHGPPHIIDSVNW